MTNMYMPTQYIKTMEAFKTYINKLDASKKYDIDKTKNKETMAFLTFETGDGEIEVVSFVQTYTTYKKQIKKNSIINATIKKTNKGYQLLRVEE